jgi:hypothetical protein
MPNAMTCANSHHEKTSEPPAHEFGAGGTPRPRRFRQFRSCAVVAILVLGLVAGGCSSKKASNVSAGSVTTSAAGGSSNSPAAGKSVRAPKTKFVLHAGLAFGAFHRYLYKPFKAGTFKAHAHGRIRAAGAPRVFRTVAGGNAYAACSSGT